MNQQPQQLWVPVVGDLVRVAKEPWTINLQEERRNQDFLKRVGVLPASHKRTWHNTETWHTLHVPVGTLLAFDRLYLRKGMPDYNSVTFILKGDSPDPKWKSGRFWVSADDANRMFCVRVDRAPLDQALEEKRASKEARDEAKVVTSKFLNEKLQTQVFWDKIAEWVTANPKAPRNLLETYKGRTLAYSGLYYEFSRMSAKTSTRNVAAEWGGHHLGGGSSRTFISYVMRVLVSYSPETQKPVDVKFLGIEERTYP